MTATSGFPSPPPQHYAPSPPAAPTRPPPLSNDRSRWRLAVAGLIGLAISGIIAAYAAAHPGDGNPLFTLGFSAMLPMKAWLTTAATALVVVQVLSALAMWGRLPGVRSAPPWVSGLHRWSGTVAFVLTLPVAFHCVWALGFATYDTRTLVHSILGCLFYGVFATKMLALRTPKLPGWALPVLGGLLAAVLTGIWFSASLWFFTTPGLPLF